MLKFSIFDQVKLLEIKLGRSLTYKEIATMTTMDWRTVAAFMDGSAVRLDLPSVEKILRLFRDYDMSVSFDELFLVDPPFDPDDLTQRPVDRFGNPPYGESPKR